MWRSRAFEVALSLIQAEEKKAPPISAPKVSKTSYVRDVMNLTVNNRYVLFWCDWKGKVNELLLKTDKDNYRLRITNDESELLNHEYSWFREHSQEIDNVSCFEDDGVYCLHVADLSFDGYFRAEIFPHETLNISLFHIDIVRET